MKKIWDGLPSRPHDEVTYHRLTNEWWDLCIACWNHEPSLRPTISEIVKKITRIVCLFDLIRLLLIDRPLQMEHPLDSTTRTGPNGANPITKSFEAVIESAHGSIGCPRALLSVGAIKTQCEAAGNVDKPSELLHVKGNSQVNPSPNIDIPATVQEASSTTEPLESCIASVMQP